MVLVVGIVTDLDNTQYLDYCFSHILLDNNQIIMEAKEGYHISDIPKGKLGQLSKIREELLELEDAEKQNSIIMIYVEMSDLFGALEAYAEKNGLSMDDLKTFSDITKRAFRNGIRK
jgi:phosphoribosyl-ATP pyrophosphohydrolase